MNGFFSDYFNELFDWFCDRLGFLSYPLELILDILDKILNINFTDPIINIPEITEPITGQTLITATSFNFNTLLDNETLANVHSIYLVAVDAILAFAMVNLLRKKLEEVTSQ